MTLPPDDGRPIPTRRRNPATMVLVSICFIYALIMGVCIYLALHEHFDLGVGGLLFVMATAPLNLILVPRVAASFAAIEHRLEEVSRLVRTMSDHAALSDDARRVLNRGNEREVLRQAIDEDIAAGNWDAAMVLVKELADRCGFRADAEEFRRQIDKARADTLDREVADAVTYLEGLILQRRWDIALADAARIGRLYPDSARAEGLRLRVEKARADYKAGLKGMFHAAVQEDRPEEALALMKDLDSYLTEEEGAPFREIGRTVIAKAREKMGADFRQAVQDKQWQKAAQIGEKIMNEFPNSRMTDEIREAIGQIRERAGGA